MPFPFAGAGALLGGLGTLAGGLGLGGGGGGPEIRPLTPQELQMQELQNQLLQQQVNFLGGVLPAQQQAAQLQMGLLTGQGIDQFFGGQPAPLQSMMPQQQPMAPAAQLPGLSPVQQQEFVQQRTMMPGGLNKDVLEQLAQAKGDNPYEEGTYNSQELFNAINSHLAPGKEGSLGMGSIEKVMNQIGQPGSFTGSVSDFIDSLKTSKYGKTLKTLELPPESSFQAPQGAPTTPTQAGGDGQMALPSGPQNRFGQIGQNKVGQLPGLVGTTQGAPGAGSLMGKMGNFGVAQPQPAQLPNLPGLTRNVQGAPPPGMNAGGFTPQPGQFGSPGFAGMPQTPPQAPGGAPMAMGAQRPLMGSPTLPGMPGGQQGLQMPQQQPGFSPPPGAFPQAQQVSQFGQGTLGGMQNFPGILGQQGGMLGLDAQAQAAQQLSQIGLTPFEQALRMTQLGTETGLTPMRGQLEAQQIGSAGRLLPGQEAMLGAQQGLGTGQAQMESSLLPFEQLLRATQMGTEQGLVGQRGGLESAQMAASQGLIPGRQDLTQQMLTGGQLPGQFGQIGQSYGQDPNVQMAINQAMQTMQNQRGLTPQNFGGMGDVLGRQAGLIGAENAARQRQENVQLMQTGLGSRGF